MPCPRTVLITGATSAIGSALAREYAGSEIKLYLHGRNVEKLAAVVRDCEARGAQVQASSFDVRDMDAMRRWLQGVGAVDLAIVNAGLNTHIGPHGEPERWEEVEALLEVNLKAMMHLVHALVPAMQQRGTGQLALMSSLAAYYGLPVTPTYCATKAGVKAYGEALRGWLADQGIGVSVIMPGYVQSPMCEAMPGPKPFLWSPERAARTIRRGLARNRARISFPFPLNWGTWWLAVLPAAVSGQIVRWLGYSRHA